MPVGQRQGFGLDSKLIEQIDWELALRRVAQDMKSDFIWAPHLRYIVERCGEALSSGLKRELKDGEFSPGLPLTIEVPKSFRIVVAGSIRRLGPVYSRPGSILPLKDRLLYQLLADQVADSIEQNTDRSRSFSHRLAGPDRGHMFVSNRLCWSELQEVLKRHMATTSVNYVLKLDIADYFGSINQHVLINTLKSIGVSAGLCDKLEAMLLAYTGQRSSRGIIQGIYPSDLLGAFYLHPVDRFFADNAIVSARYVDDVYIFVESVDKAHEIMRILTPELRAHDLRLNEAKSKILPKTLLVTEEPDLEALFDEAVLEIVEQLDENEVEEGYDFQKDWDDAPELDKEEIELEATRRLFASILTYPGHEENIERFCLPLFAKARSDHAVNHVLDAFKRRPSMAQIYAAYLGKFVDGNDHIQVELVKLLKDNELFDWQRMWIVAALCQVSSLSDDVVREVWRILSDPTRHDGLRGSAAILVGRLGDIQRRRSLFQIYPTVSEYVQLAIYFSSRSWTGVERKNARAAWGAHSEYHRAMTAGFLAAS